MMNLSQEAEKAQALLADSCKTQNFLSVVPAGWKFQVTQLKLLLLTAWQSVTAWQRDLLWEVVRRPCLSFPLRVPDRWRPRWSCIHVRAAQCTPGQACRRAVGTRRAFLDRADPDRFALIFWSCHRIVPHTAALDLCRNQSESSRT